MDAAKLHEALEMLRKLLPDGVGFGVVPDSGKSQWLELWKRGDFGPKAAQPKRVKIKVAEPKKPEIVEEKAIK